MTSAVHEDKHGDKHRDKNDRYTCLGSRCNIRTSCARYDEAANREQGARLTKLRGNIKDPSTGICKYYIKKF